MKKYPYSEGDVIVLGPECFVYKDEKVLSWKGQEYIKTCGEFVVDLPEGGQAFCTLSYDHPGVHVNTHHEKMTQRRAT